MRAGKNPLTNESEIYLDAEEAEQLKEMIRSAKLPHRRLFHKLLSEI